MAVASTVETRMVPRGRVEALHGNVGNPLSRDEGDAYGATGDRPPVFGHDDLELLRAMMRGAVIRSASQITSIGLCDWPIGHDQRALVLGDGKPAAR